MAVVEVACPGCKTVLKAPDTMAGKKAKCKKCGERFIVPGGNPGDSGGESQMLSALDTPAAPPAADPFDFMGGAAEPPPPPRKPSKVEPVPEPRKPKAAKSVPKAPTLPPPEPDDVPAAMPVDDEPAGALSLDDDPPAASGDPFSFNPSADAPKPAKKEKKERKKEPAAAASSGDPFSFDGGPDPTRDQAADEEEEEDDGNEDDADAKAKPGRSGYHRAAKAKGGEKSKVPGWVFLLVGLLVGGGGIAVALKYALRSPEVAKAEPKKGDEPAPAPTPPDPPKEKDKDKEDPKTPPPKDDTKTPPGKTPKDKTPKDTKGGTSGKTPSVPGGGSMMTLSAGKGITFNPPSDKPMPAQEAGIKITTENEFAATRRVFPPQKADIDTGVVWESKAGFQGQGGKLTLDLYSPIGKRVSRIDLDGDSANPLCDLSTVGDVFAYANAGLVTVLTTRDKKKLLDGFDPYADKPDHKKAGLGAVFLTEPPNKVVTVSTAGAVHVWDIATKKMSGEFVPSKGLPNRVFSGKSAAVAAGRQAVAVVAGGTLYQVTVRPSLVAESLADVGEVGRAFGLAMSGDRAVYAFETAAEVKSEKAVMVVGREGIHGFYRWPGDKAGEPTGAGWAGDKLVTVTTARGEAVWFEVEGKDVFRPMALVKVPGDKGLHVGGENHWSIVPSAADPKKSVLFELVMPPQGLVDDVLSTKRPVLTLRLDEKGLSR